MTMSVKAGSSAPKLENTSLNQRLGLFLVGGHPVQQCLQCAGLLAGLHQVAKQAIEVQWLAAQCAGKAVAGGHMLFEVIDQAAHAGFFHSVDDDVEGLQQRHPGLHHGGHLPGKQRDVQGLDALTAAEKRHAFLAHLERIDALFAQLCLDQGRALPVYFAFEDNAFAVLAFPGKDAGLDCFAGCHG
jgi:hypothetical protein